MFFRHVRITALFAAMIASLLLIAPQDQMNAQEAENSTSNQAGLVIYYDEDSIDYHLFDLPDDDIDAVELLTLTELELEVEPFGDLGEAVCFIDGYGCPSSDCFCEANSDPAYFWQFYAYDGDQWAPQLEGGSQHTVEDGDILGWIWTDGNPELPDVTFEVLEERATASGDAREESDESATDFVPYIVLFGLLAGVIALVGVRRFRQAQTK